MGITLGELVSIVLNTLTLIFVGITLYYTERGTTLLKELLQSIVGKVEDGEPFIHGAPPWV